MDNMKKGSVQYKVMQINCILCVHQNEVLFNVRRTSDKANIILKAQCYCCYFLFVEEKENSQRDYLLTGKAFET